MLRIIASLFATATILASTPGQAQQLDEGWWVVVASFSAEATEDFEAEFESVIAAASRCGVSTFNDFSAKFIGFEPGYNVFVIGAYASRDEAADVLQRSKACFPDAFLKKGRYAGE